MAKTNYACGLCSCRLCRYSIARVVVRRDVKAPERSYAQNWKRTTVENCFSRRSRNAVVFRSHPASFSPSLHSSTRIRNAFPSLFSSKGKKTAHPGSLEEEHASRLSHPERRKSKRTGREACFKAASLTPVSVRFRDRRNLGTNDYRQRAGCEVFFF